MKEELSKEDKFLLTVKRSIRATRKEDLIEIRKYLYEYNGNPNIPILYEEHAYSPLAYAAHYGISEIVDELLNHPEIDVNYVPETSNDKQQVIPIVGAVYGGYNKSLTIIDKLLKKGANINMIDPNDKTPLMHAAEIGLPDMVQHLIDRGADVNINTYFNAFFLSIKCFDFYSSGGLRKRNINHSKVFEILLNAGSEYLSIMPCSDDCNIIAGIIYMYDYRVEYNTDHNITHHVDLESLCKYIQTERGQDLILSKSPRLYNYFIKHDIQLHPNIIKKFEYAGVTNELNLL